MAVLGLVSFCQVVATVWQDLCPPRESLVVEGRVNHGPVEGATIGRLLPVCCIVQGPGCPLEISLGPDDGPQVSHERRARELGGQDSDQGGVALRPE